MCARTQVQWKQYFTRHEKFRTLCLSCIAKNADKERFAAAGGISGLGGGGADGAPRAARAWVRWRLDSATRGARAVDRPRFGAVFLGAAQKAIVQRWLAQARTRIRTGIGGRPRGEISDDDAADDADGAPAWKRAPVRLSAASRGILRLWVARARESAAATVGDGGRKRAGKGGRQVAYGK